MLAIKEAAADLSPYVRKTSAHAIQKLYRYSSVIWCRLAALVSPAGSDHHLIPERWAEQLIQ